MDLIYNIFVLLLSISSAASQQAETVEFTVASNGDTSVNIPCTGNTIVAFDDVMVSSSNDDCRLAALLWLSEVYLGQAGGPQTATASDLTGCNKNEVVEVTYRCVASDQVINICSFNANQDVTVGSVVYVTSPRFPAQYPVNRDCKTYFNLNMMSQYKLLFMDLHERPTPGCYDRLTFFQDYEVHGELEEGTLCGNRLFSDDGLAVSEDTVFNKLAVRFYSDASTYNLEHLGFLIRIDPMTWCDPDPCDSSIGEVCVDDHVTQSYVCEVQDGQTSTTATSTTTTTTTTTTPTSTTATDPPDLFDDCRGVVCQNGGVCVDDFNAYICECLPGFYGTLCEDISCTPNPCENGGRCEITGLGIDCTCTIDFSGDYCEEASSAIRLLRTTLVTFMCLISAVLLH